MGHSERPRLPSPIIAGGCAVAAAWLLALLFALPLSSGPVDQAAAGRVIERQLKPQDLTRADSYRTGQRRITLGSIAVELALLTALVLWRPPPLRRLFAWLGRRPLTGAGLTGAGLALLLSLASIPLGLVALERGHRFGLLTVTPGGWLGDLALSTGIAMLIAAVAATVAMYLWRRLRGRFWLAAAVLAIAYATVSIWLWPVVVSPLFNRFEPLPEGPARTTVLDLAGRAGVGVGQVFVVDASRRSNAYNAYVNGIGSTRRVVIYDNALKHLGAPELRSLVAHELAHVRSGDLPRGLLYAVLVIPLGALALQSGTGWLVERAGRGRDGPEVIPALALVLTVLILLLNVPGNWLSRQMEAGADAAAIELAGSKGLIGLQLRLVRRNLGDPDPPGAWQFLFGTHPTAQQRIGMAIAAGDGR